MAAKLPYSTEFLERVRAAVGTPFYLYDAERLKAAAAAVASFPRVFGFTPRYAMKANSNRAIMRLFHEAGLQIDASSGYEAERAMRAGIPPGHISLSSQELPANLAELMEAGVSVNACSLEQIERIGKERPGSAIGLRLNPGRGSGASRKTNTGGPTSSFGIWHAWAELARDRAQKHRMNIFRIHTHIGSGTDPEVWKQVAGASLQLMGRFPEADTLNLGGGFKVDRMGEGPDADLGEIGEAVRQQVEAFCQATDREVNLEIEPGTWLTANAGFLVCTVQDVVSTGTDGYNFYKLDAGMTELLRPSLYGSQHPIWIPDGETRWKEEAVVVGHCCESGDLMTPEERDPDTLGPRQLPRARAGDLAVVGGCGAYCASMSAVNYNSFPQAPEVLVEGGQFRVIRKRQTLDQMIANELE